MQRYITNNVYTTITAKEKSALFFKIKSAKICGNLKQHFLEICIFFMQNFSEISVSNNRKFLQIFFFAEQVHNCFGIK